MIWNQRLNLIWSFSKTYYSMDQITVYMYTQLLLFNWVVFILPRQYSNKYDNRCQSHFLFVISQAESLKTQLQFKERELAEAQSTYRSLEQRLQTNNNTSIMAKNPITPPRNSPRFTVSSSMGRREQASAATPQQEGGFPTKESFMQTNPALGSPAKVKMRLVDECSTSKGILRSPKRVASRSPGLYAWNNSRWYQLNGNWCVCPILPCFSCLNVS